VTALLALAAGASGSHGEPVALAPRPARGVPPDVSAAVERVWIEPTFSRTLNGRSAHVPFDVYVAFLDTPEVTAAAARFRKLGPMRFKHSMTTAIGAPTATEPRGRAGAPSRATTARHPFPGAANGWILGTIRGSTLTVLGPRAARGRGESEPHGLCPHRQPCRRLRGLDCSWRASGSSPTASWARGSASRRRSPSGRSTGFWRLL